MRKFYLGLVLSCLFYPLLSGQGCAVLPEVAPPETPIERAHRICTQEFYITESDWETLEWGVRFDFEREITYQAEVHSAMSGCDMCGACSNCAMSLIDAVYAGAP
jgi:hypothetical protein